MALTNTLNEIGNAIREYTGGTELIPLKDMPSYISNISGTAYNQGYADGVNNSPNPLEYAITMATAYKGVTFPDNYELTLDVPNVTTLVSLLHNAKGIKKIMLKGNTAGNVVSFAEAFRACKSL